jgi:hypothetical protein
VDVVQGNLGLERPSNASPKLSGDASRLLVVLFGNCPVMRLQGVAAAAAIPQFATAARLTCLGTGTVERGAGGGDGAEAAEDLGGHHRLLLFTYSLLCGRCTRC